MERCLDAFERAYPQIRVVRLRPGFIFKRAAASEQHRLFLGPPLPRTVRVPRAPVRAAVWLAWQLHGILVSPYLFDAFLRSPLTDTGRAGTELGWPAIQAHGRRWKSSWAVCGPVRGRQRHLWRPLRPGDGLMSCVPAWVRAPERGDSRRIRR